MSTAAPAAPIARSSSHRNPAPMDPAQQPHRAQSTSTRPGAPPASPRRSASQSQSQSHRPSSSQQAALANVARRDFEQSNLPQVPPPPSGGQRSPSRDRTAYPARTDSLRNHSHHRTSSRPEQTRYAPMDSAVVPPAPTNGVAAEASPRPAPSSSSQPRRRTTLTAPSGTWSLGKTIGAGSMGKVKLAKNLETGEQVAIKIVPRQSTDEHRSPAERERADQSKEVRTAREAAIVSLVKHPYICGMRDVVRTAHHWYMLFEYVNGGQMLDYIISHGRLREKQARKFARQIASALDYCHRNSIVHRDLKIENILISKVGDIKIIDFGLSNLFSPHGHLKTFCGSLYFAAPELLQARQYTGPEVDVWSFGIVLYVLVCGKVPFDDQSMPQLHAKIKKGFVEYPPWLTAECKNLISRMLVTDPRQRATLGEIMNHPWMIKGFNGPPENYLPAREPLHFPLDTTVIQEMTGFDFGTPEHITATLTRAIQSEEYQRAVRNMNRKHPSNQGETDRKRGMFDFYKRRNSATSGEALNSASAEQVNTGEDPINAFHPMISIYYLVREKLDLDRQGRSSAPSAEQIQMPDLPAPAAAYTNANTYEMAGEAPTGGRTRPRARTHGEDEVTDDLKKLALQQNDGPPSVPHPAENPPVKKESATTSLLRRFSTRKRRDNYPERDHSMRDRDRTHRSDFAHPPPPHPVHQTPPTPSVEISSPAEANTNTPPPPRKSFSVRRIRGEREAPSSASLHVTGSQRQQPELLTPPATSGEGFPRRFMSLRRSASVDRRRLARRAEVQPPGTPSDGPPPSSDGESFNKQQPEQDAAGSRPAAATRAKSLGHARRESIQARRARREQIREPSGSNVPEETDAEVAEAAAAAEAAEHSSEEAMKPVYLKGLFSVSTTSSKPLPVIRADIIRVLRQLGVEFEEIRGGFECRHAPSIDLRRVEALPVPGSGAGLNPPAYYERGVGGNASGQSGHRRKISFGGIMGGEGRDEFRANHAPGTPRGSTSLRPQGQASPTGSEEYSSESESVRRARKAPRSTPRGETSTRVREDVGESLVLRFEIFIVKVPLLSLHGIQFKKVDGNMMQYKNMAQEILKALRL
ncbi:Pkinase-domain-containing protein [Trichodelitschia bisporula]|uniref:non-specific serine/threonine protein kinase n=1 Tax=Trichodelitschia bisporula TaxID=703511 RepID=A0A6G1HYK5_9PEZI|nr:Pkinase-domain-containing protein [Trichodelitschia bisporula]